MSSGKWRPFVSASMFNPCNKQWDHSMARHANYQLEFPESTQRKIDRKTDQLWRVVITTLRAEQNGPTLTGYIFKGIVFDTILIRGFVFTSVCFSGFSWREKGFITSKTWTFTCTKPPTLWRHQNMWNLCDFAREAIRHTSLFICLAGKFT